MLSYHVHKESESTVQNHGRDFPSDQESLSNEQSDNIHDNFLESIDVIDEGIEGSKHDDPGVESVIKFHPDHIEQSIIDQNNKFINVKAIDQTH